MFSKFMMTVVAITLTFAVGVSQGRAQSSTVQTASGLLSVLNTIPGIDSLPVSDVQVENDYTSATVMLHDQSMTLVGFEVNSQKMVAVIPATFDITKLTPIPAGTPLDHIQFSNMAFVIVPAGGAQTGVSVSSLPSQVSAALSPSGSSVDLKVGLNLFGEADVSTSGAISDILRPLGITGLTLPLNGGFPTSLFSQNPKTAATSFKNRILDNLDITLSLPDLTGLGLPSSVTVQKSELKINSANTDGTRTIEVGVKGELDVNVAGKTLTFDFDVDVQKAAGKPAVISISGVEDPATSVTVSLLEDFTLTNLAFNINKASGKWIWDVSGDTSFNNATVNATFVKDAVNGNYMNLNTTQTMAQLLGMSGLPGLDDVVLDVIQVRPQYFFLQAEVKGKTTNVMAFKQPDTSKHYLSVQIGNISPASLIPGAANTPLKDVQFQGLNFLYSPVTTTQAIADATLPDQVKPWVAYGGADAQIKPGLNIYGVMSVHPTGEMKDLLNEVGISLTAIPLKGGFSPAVFSGGSNPSTSIKNQILDNLDIAFPLPNIDVPGISSIANIQHSALSIKGLNKGGVRSLDIKVVGELDVSISGSTLVLDYDAEVIKAQGKPPSIHISARQAQNDTFDIKMVETLSVTNLNFDLKMGDTEYFWTLGGDTTFRNKPVDILYVHNPAVGGQFLYVNAEMKLSEIAGSSLNLPGLDDVILENIQVWPNKFVLESKIRDVNIWAIAFKVPGISKPYVSVQFGNVSPASLIPGAENTPLNDVDFTNLSFLYSPASTAKLASQSNLVPNVAGWLSYAGADITIKPGLNIFGKMDIHPGGEMATLLGKVGITNINLPLNGGFSKSAFGDHGQDSIKNAIMAALDINVPLPTPNIAGLSSALTFNNGKMHIKGTMPDGSAGISISVSGDADVHFGPSDSVDFAVDVTYDRARGGAQKELKVTGSTLTPWNDPFGVLWIDLTDLSVSFDEKTTGTTSDWNVSVDAKSTIGHHSNLDVTVNVTEENGALTDATFTLDGPLDLAEVPGINDIPAIKDLTITSLTASSHGIEAITTFKNKQTDFFAFENGSNWVVALMQNDFGLTEIVPALGVTPLKGIQLSEAAIVYTQSNMVGNLSSFGPVAQTAFKDIYQITPTNNIDPEIDIAQGLNLIAAFEHSKSKGSMKTGMSKLGMSEERVILTGDIGGLMGDNNPHVNLSVALSQHGRPHNMPKWMNFADSTDIVFSMFGSDAGDDPVVEIGIGVDINTVIHDDELTFAAKVALEFQEEAAEIKFVMDLTNGNLNNGSTTAPGLNCSLTNSPKHASPTGPAGWHRPFGIPGFTLYNVAMDIGVDEDGAIQLGFAGGAKIANDRVCVAGDVGLLLEAEGAPQDIAFIGAADRVQADFLQNLAIQVATDLAQGNKTTRGIVSEFPLSDISIIMGEMPQPEYLNVKFAFVTPGASDPDLNIQGEGVALKGEMSWLGKLLGSVDLAVGPRTGLKIDGTIGEPKPDGTAGNLNLGPLAFKNTYLDFQIPMPPHNPLNGYFKLNADLEVPLIDINESIHVDVSNNNMSFSITNTLFADFSETIAMDLTGVDLSVTHPSIDHADFAMSGILKADFGTFIETSLKATLNAAFDEMKDKLNKGKKKIETAQAKVDKLNGEINHERAVVRAERAKVEHQLESAQAKVDELAGDISHDWRKYHGCGGWFPWPCKIRWGITIGFEKGAKDVADEALHLVEELVKHVPIDFDPRIWPLIAAKETAMGALKLAEYSIEGLTDLDSLLLSGLDKIENAVGGSVNLKKASFNGSLTDVIEHDDPVDLFIDVEVFGADFKDTFAFKLGDAADELANLGKKGANDFAHLSLLGLVGVDHLFNKVLNDIPASFKRQLRENVGNKIHTAQTALRTELRNDAGLFDRYHQQAQTLVASGAVFSDDYVASLMHAPVTVLDKEPASETFADAQFEIASTGLCLTVGDYQNSQSEEDNFNACAASSEANRGNWGVSLAAQKFTTENAVHASGKNQGKPNGYIYIKNSREGYDSCLSIHGTWQFDEVDFDGSLVEQERFHPSQYGENKAIPVFQNRPRSCGTAPEFQWKILKHGEDYYQLHNRATQTCAWLKSSNDGYGDYSNRLAMVPCVGTNTGVFRIADPKAIVYHRVGLPLKIAYAESRGYAQSIASSNASMNYDQSIEQGCASGANGDSDQHVAGFDTCDKPFKPQYSGANYGSGYDLFDYFVDDLGRRRFVSRSHSNKCLQGLENMGLGGITYGYTDCNGQDSDQWMTVTEVVGGLQLSNYGANASGVGYEKLSAGSKFPDPLSILTMPLNPKAGITWGANTGQFTQKAMDVAFTSKDQTNASIQAKATAWMSITSKLKAKTNDLAAGKQACVESGNKSYCYRLGMKTGFVLETVAQGQPITKLADGAPLLGGDVGYAMAGLIQDIGHLSPPKEPKWFICRMQTGDRDTNDIPFFMPGVIQGQNNCNIVNGKNRYQAWGAFKPLKSGTDVFWQPAGGGYLPSSAVITGRADLNTASGAFNALNNRTGQLTGRNISVFSCRVMVQRKTLVGWTIGGNFCHVPWLGGGGVVQNFEVLTMARSQAAPPPPPPPPAPSCTFEMVQNYYANYQQGGSGTCTKRQYNQLNPYCHFNSRANGYCGNGLPQNDPYGASDEGNTWW